MTTPDTTDAREIADYLSGSIGRWHSGAAPMLRALADELERLRAQVAPAWRPIDEAPENTPRPVVVGWVDAEGQEQTCFDFTEDGCWSEWHDHAEHVEVIGGHGVSYTPPYTHFLEVPPLSAAPAQQAEPTTGSWVRADDVAELTRRLDVALNGATGAAAQASLCDIVSQVEQRAAQQAPSVTVGEREAYEAHQSRTGWAESDLADKCSEGAPRAGEYRNTRLQDEWEIWQARAALGPAAQAEPGASVNDGARVFARVMEYQGKDRREVRSPNMTARECIALANYIHASDRAAKPVAWSKTVESAALLLNRCTQLPLDDCEGLARTILGMAPPSNPPAQGVEAKP